MKSFFNFSMHLMYCSPVTVRESSFSPCYRAGVTEAVETAATSFVRAYFGFLSFCYSGFFSSGIGTSFTFI